jgi:hypothetical protein
MWLAQSPFPDKTKGYANVEFNEKFLQLHNPMLIHGMGLN